MNEKKDIFINIVKEWAKKEIVFSYKNFVAISSSHTLSIGCISLYTVDKNKDVKNIVIKGNDYMENNIRVPFDMDEVEQTLSYDVDNNFNYDNYYILCVFSSPFSSEKLEYPLRLTGSKKIDFAKFVLYEYRRIKRNNNIDSVIDG